MKKLIYLIFVNILSILDRILLSFENFLSIDNIISYIIYDLEKKLFFLYNKKCQLVYYFKIL